MIEPSPSFRRGLLWLMLASVAVGAAVGIITFLGSTFSPASMRVMLTLATLAYHCGVALSIFAAGDKGLAPAVGGVGLVAFCLNFVLTLCAIWVMDAGWGLRAFFSTLALSGYFAMASAHGRLLPMRPGSPLARGGLAVCAAGLAFSLYFVWSINGRVDEAMWKALWLALVVSFTLAHFSLLATNITAASLAIFRIGAMLAAVLLATLLSVIVLSPESMTEDMVTRLIGALGVLDAAATLTAIIMQRLRAGETADSIARIAADVRVQLTCPRCATAQRMALGGSACGQCGLKFIIQIPNLTCAGCGYPLLNIPARVCPECGLAF